jgi:hypothetical protein
MNSPILKPALVLAMAILMTHCTSVQSEICPTGQQLAPSGDSCEPIECNGGQLEGDECVCPEGEVLDEVTCRDPNDPCIGLGCNDGNGCTADNCTQGSCSFDAVPDGERCTIGDQAGLCIAGACDENPCASVDCDDGNPCTVNPTCNPSNARCEGGRDAADGTSCPFGDFPGTCVSGRCEDAMLCANVDCDDANPCTDDLCARSTGQCSNVALTELSPCELDGVLGECMSQVCVGLCEDEETRCNDFDSCTIDSCDVATGCVNAPKNCSDANSCTDDLCAPSTGVCSYPIRPNGSSCTISGGAIKIPGTCQNGTCESLVFQP